MSSQRSSPGERVGGGKQKQERTGSNEPGARDLAGERQPRTDHKPNQRETSHGVNFQKASPSTGNPLNAEKINDGGGQQQGQEASIPSAVEQIACSEEQPQSGTLGKLPVEQNHAAEQQSILPCHK